MIKFKKCISLLLLIISALIAGEAMSNPSFTFKTFEMMPNDSSLVVPESSRNLGDYTWENRLVLLYAPSAEHFQYRRQLKNLAGHTSGLAERDILILHATGKGEPKIHSAQEHLHRLVKNETVPEIATKYDIPPTNFSILLIGKDGTKKLQRNRPVEAEAIFERIDSMPMRQREMKDE